MHQTVRKFARGDYTVGWICALPETEFVDVNGLVSLSRHSAYLQLC